MIDATLKRILDFARSPHLPESGALLDQAQKYLDAAALIQAQANLFEMEDKIRSLGVV